MAIDLCQIGNPPLWMSHWILFFYITRLLLPLFDADTQMLFLAGKGDNTIGFHEVNERDPILTEGLR
jgi:coronin-7